MTNRKKISIVLFCLIALIIAIYPNLDEADIRFAKSRCERNFVPFSQEIVLGEMSRGWKCQAKTLFHDSTVTKIYKIVPAGSLPAFYSSGGGYSDHPHQLEDMMEWELFEYPENEPLFKKMVAEFGPVPK